MKIVKINNYTVTFGDEKNNEVLVSIHHDFETGKEQLIMQYVSKYFADMLLEVLNYER